MTRLIGWIIASIIATATLSSFASSGPTPPADPQISASPSVAAPTTTPTPPAISPSPSPTKTAKVEVKTEQKETVLEFASKTIQDATLFIGETKTISAGAQGKEVVTYEVTYIDSRETQRKAIKTERIDPVDRVIATGTKSKPIETTSTTSSNQVGDTYTNSAGNQVQRPIYSDSIPAGASAQCKDGTYSFSQSRRGTCSGHGGVAEWL